MKTAALFAGFCAVILTANMLTDRLGMVAAGFGLTVTAGAYAAGLALSLRDSLHLAAGRWAVLAAIAAGTILTVAIAPGLALASAVAFAVSELADFAVYSRLESAGWYRAVAVSNAVGAVIDTFVFLGIAGFPITPATVAGALLVKAVWCTAAYLIAAKGVGVAVSGERLLTRDP